MGGASDEREQTLNQILTEMDGFNSTTGVLVMAATNRIDILDPALIRPGRFDRQITLNLPNLKERESILKVHARGKKLDPEISFSQISQRTVGFSGADLANVLNEAALLAARYKQKSISMKEVNKSIDRLIIGLEGRQFSRINSRQLTAFHEMGHAVIGTLIDENQPIQKVSILPRGNTQGTTWTIPSSSQYSSRESFINQILIALSGRATEEMINGVGEYTVGAQQDINQVTRILRMMVLRYSMARLQELKQEAQQRNLYLIGSDVKIELNNIIDNFTTNFLDISYNEVLRTLDILRPTGERVVDQLVTFEELSGKDLRRIIKEYISSARARELLSSTRKSSLSSLVPSRLRKSTNDVEDDIKRLLSKVV
jgi:cell division protease FtsH